MTELPLPPDPSPEQLAYQRRVVGGYQDYIDAISAVAELAGVMTPERRKALNDVSRRFQGVAEKFADLEQQVAGRPPRKPPQRGQIPKRAARKRLVVPKATAADVTRLQRDVGLGDDPDMTDLLERLGLAPAAPAGTPPEDNAEPVDERHNDDEPEQDDR